MYQANADLINDEKTMLRNNTAMTKLLASALYLFSCCLMLMACGNSDQSSAVAPIAKPQAETVAHGKGPLSDSAGNPVRNAYFGETHMHTAYTQHFDAPQPLMGSI